MRSDFLGRKIIAALVCALLIVLIVGAVVIFNDLHELLLSVNSLSQNASTQTSQISAAVQGEVKQVGVSTSHLDGIIADERTAQKLQMREFNKSLAHLSDLLAHTDISLNGTPQHPGAIAQIVENSQAIVPMAKQTQQDLLDLDPIIRQMLPLAQSTTAITEHVSGVTADVEHEVHKLVYPPPRKWYQKWFLDPLKTAAHLITIPITSF